MRKLLILLLLSSLVLFSGCIDQKKEVTTTTIQTPTTTETTIVISTTTTAIESYTGLYKEPTNFEGYQYCIFVFDYGQEKYVNETEHVYKKFCNITEGYPYIYEFLYDKYKVDIEKEYWTTAALYMGKGRIILNDQFKKAKNLDLYIAHEIAHSSTEGLNLPAWLNEGIAVYSSYKFFGAENNLHPNWFRGGFSLWDPKKYNYEENGEGYPHAGYVVKNFIDTYGVEPFKNFLSEIYGKINYDDSVITKNKKVLDAIIKVTYNSSLTLDDITLNNENYINGGYIIENKYEIEPKLSCIYINEYFNEKEPTIMIGNDCGKGFSFDNYNLPWMSKNKTISISYYFEYFDNNNLTKVCACSLKISSEYNTTCLVTDFPKNYCPENYHCLSNYECKNIILPSIPVNMEIYAFNSGKWYLIGNELNITGEVIYP